MPRTQTSPNANRSLSPNPFAVIAVVAIALLRPEPAAAGGAVTAASFCDPVHHEIGSFPTGVTVHDITGDGWPEVIVSNGQANFISVLPNDGGTLGAAISHPVASGRPRAAEVDDLDGDGDEDLVVAVRDSPGSIAVFLNAGGGAFGTSTIYGPPSAAFALALADFDGDGDRDAAVFSSSIIGGEVVVLDNLGDGTFSSGVAYPAIDTDIIYAADLVAADVNGDGRPDVVVTSDCPIDCGPHTVVLLAGETGALGAPIPFDAGLNQPTGLAAADFDGDGDPDLAVIDCVFHDQSLVIALNDGAGGFVESARHGVTEVCHSFTTPAAIAAGDVNGDGAPDVVIGAHRRDEVQVFVNLGDGTFDGPSPFATADEPMTVTIGDVDADGRTDVVTASLVGIGSPGRASVLRNRAGAPADVNGDGVVSVTDLVLVLTAWGPCPGCPEDTDGDGVVGLLDLLSILTSWGTCP